MTSTVAGVWRAVRPRRLALVAIALLLSGVAPVVPARPAGGFWTTGAGGVRGLAVRVRFGLGVDRRAAGRCCGAVTLTGGSGPAPGPSDGAVWAIQALAAA